MTGWETLREKPEIAAPRPRRDCMTEAKPSRLKSTAERGIKRPPMWNYVALKAVDAVEAWYVGNVRLANSVLLVLPPVRVRRPWGSQHGGDIPYAMS
jgi:hypothetical protein